MDTACAPATLAEDIRTSERRLRRILPNAPVEIQTIALQVLDQTGQTQLLSPKVVTVLSAPRVQQSPEGLTTYTAWMKWAESYLGVLRRVRELVEKPAHASQTAPST